ncbi:hypothetical protein Dcar01_01042 [Deinococcus carri]|uniref:PepSY domain-containing protein n=1 Tax=Deinococcus carri TaxID=1211323 RepID=A0ABP9W715_9DEIO
MKRAVLTAVLVLSGALAQGTTTQGMGQGGDMMQACMQMMQGMGGAGSMPMMGGPADPAPDLGRTAIEAVARAFLQGQSTGGPVRITGVDRSGEVYQVRYLRGTRAGTLRIHATSGDVLPASR